MIPPPPLHIALIPDGNRRWARAQGLLPWKGHEKSAASFRSIVEWCAKDHRVGTLTFWAFSTENWKRDPEEVTKLMQLFEKYIRSEREDLQQNRIRVLRSGRTDRLPGSLRVLLEEIERDPIEDPTLTLHVALDYGGKDEVTRAAQSLSNTSDITEESIRTNLDQPELPDIDLIIRTSGEKRTSNFFLWQSAYAEWIFLDKHFPEFNERDMEEAIQEFDARKRRFGR